MKRELLLGMTCVGILSACQVTTVSPLGETVRNCNGSTTKCVVNVTSTDTAGRTGKVDIDGLILDSGFHNIHIYWRLPAGCAFRASAGDGVLLKDGDDGQFVDRFATDDENDHPTPNPNAARKYHWKAKNDANAGHKYNYKLVFHCDNGAPFVIDPWIQNG